MTKPRVVMFPAPLVGHLLAMIKLAKLTLRHHNNLSFTILLMPNPFSPTANNPHIAATTASGLNIDFIHLPAIHEVDKTKVVTMLSECTIRSKPAFETALRSLHQTYPVSALLLDFFNTTILDIAMELTIPSYIFFTSAAAQLSLMLYLPTLHEASISDFRERRERIAIPGMLPVPPNDLPTPILDRKDSEYEWFLYHSRRYREAKGIVINTFYDLELKVLNALFNGDCLPDHPTPTIYTVGPLLDNLESAGDDDHQTILWAAKSTGDDDSHECIKWLNDQPNGSVLFLCFGSMGRMDTDQVREIASGLELSGCRFLWAVRVRSNEGPKVALHSDMSLDEGLPLGFVERTKGHGLVWLEWVPQIEILSHKAIGGFVSHCGWNSILESIWFGVPVIAWPMYAEQRMNAFGLVNDLGLSLEVKRLMEGDQVDGLVKGEELERVIRVLMEGDEGKRVREKVRRMKEMGRRSMVKGGSSFVSLELVAAEWSKSY